MRPPSKMGRKTSGNFRDTYFAIIAVFLNLVSSKAIEKQSVDENSESNEPALPDEREGGKHPEEDEEEFEQITEEMLRKHCQTPEAALDFIMCDNSLPANMRNRERVKGKNHIDLIDGDLIVDKRFRDTFKPHHRSRRVAIDRRWPAKHDRTVEIPYQYRTGFGDVRTMFEAAIDDYRRHTCIRFVPRKATDVNYLNVISDSGCYTFAGMVGGPQILSLQTSSYCTRTKGVAIHEAMHVLGFLHTQARRDRSDYITVHFQNIPASLHSQFKVHDYGEAHVYGVSYDKKSVMHYGRTSGASGGFSITSNSDPNEKLGQRDGFSPKDILQINRMYCKHLVNKLT